MLTLVHISTPTYGSHPTVWLAYSVTQFNVNNICTHMQFVVLSFEVTGCEFGMPAAHDYRTDVSHIFSSSFSVTTQYLCSPAACGSLLGSYSLLS
jgi:hypothetical protein